MALADMPPAAVTAPVSATPLPPLLTYESYMAMPRIEGSYDILDGELITMPGASYPHQFIVVNLVGLFLAFQKATRSGRTLTAPCDVLISRIPLRTRQPDVTFVSNKRLAEAGGVPQNGPLSLGPELIVEVLSPSETRSSVLRKLEDYRCVGVREAWLVGRETETIEVLRLSETGIETIAVYVNGQTAVSEAIPGLTVALADVFDEQS